LRVWDNSVWSEQRDAGGAESAETSRQVSAPVYAECAAADM